MFFRNVKKTKSRSRFGRIPVSGTNRHTAFYSLCGKPFWILCSIFSLSPSISLPLSSSISLLLQPSISLLLLSSASLSVVGDGAAAALTAVSVFFDHRVLCVCWILPNSSCEVSARAVPGWAARWFICQEREKSILVSLLRSHCLASASSALEKRRRSWRSPASTPGMSPGRPLTSLSSP